jgi:hypothetical protein
VLRFLQVPLLTFAPLDSLARSSMSPWNRYQRSGQVRSRRDSAGRRGCLLCAGAYSITGRNLANGNPLVAVIFPAPRSQTSEALQYKISRRLINRLCVLAVEPQEPSTFLIGTTVRLFYQLQGKSPRRNPISPGKRTDSVSVLSGLARDPGRSLVDDPSQKPSCEDYMRMPVTEAVLEHIMVCDSCRAEFKRLADDLDRYSFERQHRN